MKYYFRIKMLLVTFTLGMVGVWVFADSYTCQSDLNSRQSSEAIIVVPVENVPPLTRLEDKDENISSHGGGGGSGGVSCDEARAEALRKKKKFDHPNCR